MEDPGHRPGDPGQGMSAKVGAVPAGIGTVPVLAAPDQAALTSIILGVAACGTGTLTSSMPCACVASTWAASTP